MELSNYARLAGALAVTVSMFACGGPPPEPVAPPEPPPASTEPEETVHKASIEVYSRDGTEILVDGKSIGQAPIKKDELPAGPHDVTFVDDRTGNRTMSVNLAP